MKIDGEHYFESPTEDNIEAWPTVLREAKAKELCLSALGALIWYLQTVSNSRMPSKDVTLTTPAQNRA